MPLKRFISFKRILILPFILLGIFFYLAFSSSTVYSRDYAKSAGVCPWVVNNPFFQVIRYPHFREGKYQLTKQARADLEFLPEEIKEKLKPLHDIGYDTPKEMAVAIDEVFDDRIFSILYINIIIDYAEPSFCRDTDEFSQTLLMENDGPQGTDSYYTGGFRHEFWYHSRVNNKSIEETIESGSERFQYAYPIGLEVYTPSEIYTKERQINERPYSAWFYTGVAIEKRSKKDGNWQSRNKFEINVGFIGPQAQGEIFQGGLHVLVNTRVGRGWDNQIPQAFGSVLEWEYQNTYQIREGEFSQWNFDLSYFHNLRLGNIFTDFTPSLMLRVGLLKSDYYQGVEGAPCGLFCFEQFYLFTKHSFRFIGHNATLECSIGDSSCQHEDPYTGVHYIRPENVRRGLPRTETGFLLQYGEINFGYSEVSQLSAIQGSYQGIKYNEDTHSYSRFLISTNYEF